MIEFIRSALATVAEWLRVLGGILRSCWMQLSKASKRHSIRASLLVGVWAFLFTFGFHVPSGWYLWEIQNPDDEWNITPFILLILSWSWTNALGLGCISAMIGEYGRSLFSNSRPNTTRAMMMGFVAFIIVADGRLLISGASPIGTSAIERPSRKPKDGVTQEAEKDSNPLNRSLQETAREWLGINDEKKVNKVDPQAAYFALATYTSFLSFFLAFQVDTLKRLVGTLTHQELPNEKATLPRPSK